MHIVVLVKQVPHHDYATALDASGRLVRSGVAVELNPFCRRAVAHAVQLARQHGGVTTAVTMGPPSAADVLREAQACGVDHAVHLCDPALAGSDCLATARALGAALAGLPPADLIIAGRSSVDADTAAIGPMVAEVLDLPFVGPALSLSITESPAHGAFLNATLQQDDAEHDVEVRLPAIVAVAERSISPAKAHREEWPDVELPALTTADLGPGLWGEPVSGTRVVAVRPTGRLRAGARPTGTLAEQVSRAVDVLLDRGALDGSRDTYTPELVAAAGHTAGPEVLVLVGDRAESALVGEAASISARVNGHVVAVGAAGTMIDAPSWGADSVVNIETGEPRPLASALAASYPRPWAVIGPATAWGRELLARLAVRLDAGLIADAVSLEVVIGPNGDRRLRGCKPAGNRTVADIECRSAIQLASVRVGCLARRAARVPPPGVSTRNLDVATDAAIVHVSRRPTDQPDALDAAPVVIGVGRGVPPDRYDDLEGLRSLLDAQFAATRPVTDAGWLPHGRQVGITARNIAPRLYLAIGIAGSGNHLAGISRAGTVVAINADPSAAIIDAADASIIADWQHAVPELAAELTRRLS